MGNLLSREEILASETKTGTVEAFGGQVLVREMPASLVQNMFESGVIAEQGVDEQGEAIVGMRYEKLDFISIAAACICDENGDAILDKNDVRKLAEKGFHNIQAVVEKAINLTDFSADSPPKA